jgi:virulence-associated protein VapD
MFAIAFDLIVQELVIHYPGHPAQAYQEIRDLLGREGFAWTQGSVYVSETDDLVALTRAMNRLRALPWFRLCVRDIRAFRVEQWSNFTEFMKS